MRVAQGDAGVAARTPQALGTTTGDKMFHTGSENGFRLNQSKKNTSSVAAADEAQDDEKNADDEGSVEPMNEDDDEEKVAPDAPDKEGGRPVSDDQSSDGDES